MSRSNDPLMAFSFRQRRPRRAPAPSSPTDRKPFHRDLIFLKLFVKAKAGEVSDEEVRHFRDHPDQIDELSAPVRVHLVFL